jgi:F420-non-reducing hydrogenase small subunit
MGDKVTVQEDWLCVCSGCEIAVLDLHESLLDVLQSIEFVRIPVLMDIKDFNQHTTVGILSGGIRNTDNEEVAKKVRETSDIVIALGSCAAFGGIPGANNINLMPDIKQAVLTTTSTAPDQELPTKEVPKLFDTLRPISDVIKVDYFIPGCPPTPQTIAHVLTALLQGQEPQLSKRNVCDDCDRHRDEKRIKEIQRGIEANGEPEECLLNQGFLCMGPATRDGCGAECPHANAPCTGCYGPADGSYEQGVAMLNVVASAYGLDEDPSVDLEELSKEVYDPIGTFYRYTMPISFIKAKVTETNKR